MNTPDDHEVHFPCFVQLKIVAQNGEINNEERVGRDKINGGISGDPQVGDAT